MSLFPGSVYVHKSDEFYEWPINKSKCYYNHLIVDNIVEPLTSQTYWSNFTGLSLFNESCMRKIKMLKDKKLAETKLKILNILPCNRNLLKWGEK